MSPSSPRTAPNTSLTRSRGPLVLAVGMGTLARSPFEDITQLSELLRQRPHTSILYAAPERSLVSIKTCLEVLRLPHADVLVADRGASVQAAKRNASFDALDATIGAQWPGVYEVRGRVAGLGHLLGEHRREQSRRVTLFPQPGVPLEDARSAVEEALDGLDVDVQVSEDGLEVLPTGTNVATTVVRALHALQADPSWVVIAGSVIEPGFFDDAPFWGIATGDVPERARATLEHYNRVHTTSVKGTAGILEGLRALGFVSSGA